MTWTLFNHNFNVLPYDCSALADALEDLYGDDLVSIVDFQSWESTPQPTTVTAVAGEDLFIWVNVGDNNFDSPLLSGMMDNCPGNDVYFLNRYPGNATPVLQQNVPTIIPHASFTLGMVSTIWKDALGSNNIKLFQIRIHPSSFFHITVGLDDTSLKAINWSFFTRLFVGAVWTDTYNSPLMTFPSPIDITEVHLWQLKGNVPGLTELWIDGVSMGNQTPGAPGRWYPDYTEASGIGLAWFNQQNTASGPGSDTRVNFNSQLIWAAVGPLASSIAHSTLYDKFKQNFDPPL